MYLKLVPVHTSGYAYANEVIRAVKNFMDGTWTATSSLSSTYFDVAACELSGTAPTAGTYHTFNYVDTAGSGMELKFRKKYYNQDPGNSFEPETEILWDWGTSGPAFRASDKNSANMTPYTNSGYVSPAASGFIASYWGSNYGCQYLISLEVIFTDDLFAVNFYYSNAQNLSSGTPSGQYIGNMFFSMADFEHDAVYDNYAYSQSSAYYPGVVSLFYTGDYLTKYDTNMNNGTGHQNIWIGRYQFMDVDGTFKNNNAGYANDYTYTNMTSWSSFEYDANYIYASWFPSPHKSIPKMNLGGNSGYQLIPITYNPDASHRYYSQLDFDTRYGRIRNMFRTVDNLADTNGSSMTIGSDTYRVWPLHKCGYFSRYDYSQYTANYAFKA